MKLWDYLECFMLFGAGAMFTMIISGSIYALGAPRIIIVIAVALLLIVMAAIIGYCAGRRRNEPERLRAYNKGVQKGNSAGYERAKADFKEFLGTD